MKDVEDLAEDAGLLMYEHPGLRRFARLVAERERERAAMICHQHRDWSDNPAEAIATAILRGE
jgi:hypothetical protein